MKSLLLLLLIFSTGFAFANQALLDAALDQDYLKAKKILKEKEKLARQNIEREIEEILN